LVLFVPFVQLVLQDPLVPFGQSHLLVPFGLLHLAVPSHPRTLSHLSVLLVHVPLLHLLGL